MFARMALVWLLLMNLAVVVWWAMPQSATPARVEAADAPAGVAVLTLVEPVAVVPPEAAPPTTTAPAAMPVAVEAETACVA